MSILGNKKEGMNIQYHAFRLEPGADLKKSIQQFVIDKSMNAGWVAGCLGSLTRYAIRFADQKDSATGEGHFEILSVSGMLSVLGSHVHISIADHKGSCLGGHLVDGAIIYTTAEVIIAEVKDMVFKRELDPKTGYKELVIENASK